jgi:hypothetical protein
VLQGSVTPWLRGEAPDAWEPALRKQGRWFDPGDVDEAVAAWRAAMP